MRLDCGVLEGVDMVAPASNEGVPTDAEVPHLNQGFCQELEKHFCQEDYKGGVKKIPHTGDKASLDRCG